MNHWKAFSEAIFLLLGGTGVGYSIQFHHVSELPEITKSTKRRRFLVGDSIEGWADAVKVLTKSYFFGTPIPDFDFSDIRPRGSILKTAGGKAPGPEPLQDCLHNIRKVFERRSNGEKLRPIEVHDIMCFIADAVLAGGIRRSAMISLFSFDDEEMLTSKVGKWYELNPQRARANNSVVLLRHRVKEADFRMLWERVSKSGSGEPGIYFTNDSEVATNPCAEVSLRANQFCNLVDINVSDVSCQQELEERAAAASFIATLQAGYTNFHYLRDVWRRTTEKDALLGVGMTGIASGRVLQLDLIAAAELVKTVNEGVSKLIGINPAARTTLVKPSGTSSLVLGCSSGIHAWHDRYFLRRIRLMKNEPLYSYLETRIPDLIEDDFFKPSLEAVISIPVAAPDGAILRGGESAIDLLTRVKHVHDTWIVAGHTSGHNTHNVSTTVSVREEEWDDVGDWMWTNRDAYNGLAVFPHDGGTYVQAPFESITKTEYEHLVPYLQEIDLTNIHEYDDLTSRAQEIACAGGQCEL